jgi:hypothetical protein
VGGGIYVKGLLPLTFATGVRNVSVEEAASAARLAQAAAAWAAVAALAIGCLRLRWREGLALLAWVLAGFVIVLLPAGMRVPGALGKVALADRWLFASVAPSVLFCTGFVARIGTPRIRAFAAAVVAAWAAATVGAAPRQHAPYRDRLSQLSFEDVAYEATPPRFRTDEDECRREERALVRAARDGNVAAALRSRERIAAGLGCRERANADLTVIALLLSAGRSQEALPVARELAASGRLKGRFRFQGLAMTAETLLRNGLKEEAVSLVEGAVRDPVNDCALRELLARVYLAADRPGDAGRQYEALQRCETHQGGGEDARALREAVSAYRAAHDEDASRRLEEELRTFAPVASGR